MAQVTISYEEAIQHAETHLSDDAVLKYYDLRRVWELSHIQFPGKYRIPYELYINGLRVRRNLLILEVDRYSGNVTVAFNTFQGKGELIAKAENSSRALLASDFPRQHAALTVFRHEYPSAVLRNLELVINLQADSEQELLCWRFEFEHAALYKTLCFYVNDQYQLTPSDPQVKGRALGWQFRNVKYQSGKRRNDYLQINFEHAKLHNPDAAFLSKQQSEATLSLCLFFLSEWLAHHDFSVDMNRIRFRFVDVAETGASFHLEGSTPTVKFRRRTSAVDLGTPYSWADDPSVALHELGHALRAMFFVRPRPAIHDGIEEGFADYVAAAVLSRDVASVDSVVKVGIFAYLKTIDEDLLSLSTVPRLINGQPITGANLDHEDPHEVGRIWANFLWACRQAVGAEQADRVILQTHLDPPFTSIPEDADAFEYYISALVDYDAPQYDNWAALRQTHLFPTPTHENLRDNV